MKKVEVSPFADQHDWDELLKGDTHEAEEGVDFPDGKQASFRSKISQEARKRGLKTKTLTTDEGNVVFQVVGVIEKNGKPEEKKDE